MAKPVASKVKSVEIENISGIPTLLRVPLDGKSLFLYGENGTGKSSIVESLEWLVLESSGVVPRGRAVFDKRIRHLDHQNRSCSVKVELENGGWVKRRDHQYESDPAGEEWLERARLHLSILRRTHLLQFIDNKPAERYKIVNDWLGLEPLDQVMDLLRRAREEAETRLARLTNKLENRNDQLETQFGEVPASFQAAVEASKDYLKAANSQIPRTPGRAKSLREELFERSEPALKLRQVSEVVRPWAEGIPDDLKGAMAVHAKAAGVLRRSEKTAGSSPDEAELLSRAVRLLETTEPGTCPVCAQEIESARVLKALQARLKGLVSVQKDRTELEAAGRRLEHLQAHNREQWERLEDLGEAGLNTLLRRARRQVLACLEGEDFDSGPCEKLQEALDLASRAENEKTARVLEQANDVLKILEDWGEVETLRDKTKTAAKVVERVQLLFSLAQESRANMVGERMKAITGPVREFYRAIHPDEGIAEIRVSLPKPTPRGQRDRSAVLEVAFEEQSPEDPRVHLSEGHLDTLGLAFYLMNLKREVQESGVKPPLLVLDDVMSSVDAPHRLRVAEQILAEFKGWQILLTTHDRIWFRRLISVSQRTGHQFTARAIRRWSRQTGPDIREHLDVYQELEKKLAEGDTPQSLASLAGIMLEDLFNQVRQYFRLSVKGCRDDKWELSVLSDAVLKSLKNGLLPGWHEEHAGVIAKLESALKDIYNIRNVMGAHYRSEAEELAPSEADAFARAALRVYAAFVHVDGCLDMVAPNHDGSEVKCRCGKQIYSKTRVSVTA